MFEQSGFEITKNWWTDEMIDSILITGNEGQAGKKLDNLFDSGVSEIPFLCSINPVGRHTERSKNLLQNTAPEDYLNVLKKAVCLQPKGPVPPRLQSDLLSTY
ncbi:MAG: hypothetical protein CM1200mP3_06840 [Chloroflexota bacterium]|nr:MAG: hypothetical protein CM1200mP3_06840 [Chloroflexota bacterium]